MRVIGHLSDQQSATSFSDYLCVQGISNVVEPDGQGYAVWIYSEDQLDNARAFLTRFQTAPSDPQFQNHGEKARQLREKEAKERRIDPKKYFERNRVFGSTLLFGVGWVTLLLIVISVGVALIDWLEVNSKVLSALFISLYPRQFGLPEVMHGQIWRVITPIFLHSGFLHLFFNMLWLFDLGRMIEGRESSGRLGVKVLVIAALSNLGQFYVSGPMFGGMSGVVYGLLGYIWMKGRFDPDSGLYLHPQTVMMMLVWFVLCLVGVIPNVANTAHGVGLVGGVVWGLLATTGLFGKRR